MVYKFWSFFASMSTLFLRDFGEYMGFTDNRELVTMDKVCEFADYYPGISHREKEYYDWINDLWVKHRHYADDEFHSNFNGCNNVENLQGRIWEMLLGNSLQEHGYQLKKVSKKNGPDLCVIDEKYGKIWVECVMPTRGAPEMPDSPPPKPQTKIEFEEYGKNPIDTEKHILRVTNVFDEKKKQYERWLKNKVVSKKDFYILAINGFNLELSNYESGFFPVIVNAVYPIGNPCFTFGKESDDQSERYPYQLEIKKDNGASVSKNVFSEKKFSFIEGLLFTNEWPLERFQQFNYSYVHNFGANRHLQQKYFNFVTLEVTATDAGDNVRLELIK